MQLSKSHKDNLKSQLSWHVLDFEMNLNYLVKAMNSENKTGKPKLESFFFFLQNSGVFVWFMRLGPQAVFL